MARVSVLLTVGGMLLTSAALRVNEIDVIPIALASVLEPEKIP